MCGVLIKNKRTTIQIYQLQNETDEKRFKDGVVVETPQEVFEIIDWVIRYENRGRIQR